MMDFFIRETLKLKHETLKVQQSPNAALAYTVMLLRLAGTFVFSPQKSTLTVQLPSTIIAQHLAHNLKSLFLVESTIMPIPVNRSSCVLYADKNIRIMAKKMSLLNFKDELIRGVPNFITTSGTSILESVWKAAFIASGSLQKKTPITIACPNFEIAMALIGFSTRIGFVSQYKFLRRVHYVQVRQEEYILYFFRLMGAYEFMSNWEKIKHNFRLTDSKSTRVMNFDAANDKRAQAASSLACTKIQKAFNILGNDIPPSLLEAGSLRLKYKNLSLEELGKYANPQLTKDAIAGRIRRLFLLANKRAVELGKEKI